MEAHYQQTPFQRHLTLQISFYSSKFMVADKVSDFRFSATTHPCTLLISTMVSCRGRSPISRQTSSGTTIRAFTGESDKSLVHGIVWIVYPCGISVDWEFPVLSHPRGRRTREHRSARGIAAFHQEGTVRRILQSLLSLQIRKIRLTHKAPVRGRFRRAQRPAPSS